MDNDDGHQHPTPLRGRAVREHRRAYKACISCRKRKARCDLGGRDGPPCVRCRRELRRCVFTIERSHASGWIEPPDDHVITSPDSAGKPNPSSATPASALEIAIDSISQRSGQPSAQSAQLSPQAVNRGQAEERMPPESASYNAEVTQAGDPRVQAGSSQRRSSQPTCPRNPMQKSVLPGGSDALDILLQAATQCQRPASKHGAGPDQYGRYPPTSRPVDSLNRTRTNGSTSGPASATSKALKLWQTSWVVKMGYLSAKEALTYIDLFFENLSSRSPVLPHILADHANHDILVNREPFLCCTILMISSRYHPLSGTRGPSRSSFVHERLWDSCQSFMMRLLLGQETGTQATSRTIGSVEALLLLCEWHPKSLHFPPNPTDFDVQNSPQQADDDNTSTSSTNWFDGVVESALRSDRMSWMLLGCAVSLGHELGVFSTREQFSESADPKEQLNQIRKHRTRKLLYVFITQLASRLGAPSPLPRSLNPLDRAITREVSDPGMPWDAFMDSWIMLTKLLKSLREIVVPYEAYTAQVLRSGQYVSVLEHFRTLIDEWRGNYLELWGTSDVPCDILYLEYQYVRIYCNSIGLHAACELRENGGNTLPSLNIPEEEYPHRIYIDEVVAGCSESLERINQLADNGDLKFAPVRVFHRVISSSVFLIKALGVAARGSRWDYAVDVLTRTAQALRSTLLDDTHLAGPLATLLEVHVNRLRHDSDLYSRPLSTDQAAQRRAQQAVAQQNVDTYARPGPDVGIPSMQEPKYGGPGFDTTGTTGNDFMEGGDFNSFAFGGDGPAYGMNETMDFPEFMEANELGFLWDLSR